MYLNVVGDLLLGHPYCNTMHITLSSGDIQYFPPRLKLCARKRWSHKENIILWNTFKYNITKKVTPTSLKINKAAELLPGRTQAVIRAKISNITSGKQKFECPL